MLFPLALIKPFTLAICTPLLLSNLDTKCFKENSKACSLNYQMFINKIGTFIGKNDV